MKLASRIWYLAGVAVSLGACAGVSSKAPSGSGGTGGILHPSVDAAAGTDG